MSNRLRNRHHPAIARVRTGLEGRERTLFDLMCTAAQLGYPLPSVKINVSRVSGKKDPRRRLAREFSDVPRRPGDAKAWKRASDRLAHVLIEILEPKDLSDDNRALLIILAYTTIGLAPDCVVPRDPFYRAAWDTAVKLFARIFPSKLKALGPLACVKQQLSVLQADAAEGLRIGRRASGRRPGRAGQALALDPDLIALAGKALGKKLAPAYIARYLFYTKRGDHIWPHPDDPKPPVTLLICVSHQIPRRTRRRSAFVAYPAGARMRRYELAPGTGLVFEPGMVHAREPVRHGERVVLLSIGLAPAR